MDFAQLCSGKLMAVLRSSATRSLTTRSSTRSGLAARSFRSLAKLVGKWGCLQTFLQRNLDARPKPKWPANKRRSTRVVSMSDIFVLPTVPSSKKPNGRNWNPSFTTRSGSSTRWTTPKPREHSRPGYSQSGQRIPMGHQGQRPGSLCGVTKTMMLCQRAWTPVHQQPQGLPETFC